MTSCPPNPFALISSKDLFAITDLCSAGGSTELTTNESRLLIRVTGEGSGA